MKTLFFSAILLLAAPSALALAPGDRVDNFRLLDHKGAAHELRYLSDARAVVLMVHGNGCPVVRQALPSLRDLRDRYHAQGAGFLLLNTNLQDDRETVAKEAAEFAIDFPILLDGTQLIGESLGLTRTAEVLVIDPKTWKLVYRGPGDDRLAYDFNWQTVYLLQTPKVLPAGTRILWEMTWDNSAQNPANPDPARDVPWGDQTWDEMNAGWIRYRELPPPG